MEIVPNPFRVRPATINDTETLSDLSIRTFVSAYQGLLPKAALEDYVLTAFTIEKIQVEMSLPGSQFLLAYEAEKAVGYAFLREVGPPVGLQGDNPLELARIYLEEKVTGKGYGSRLMLACFENALGSGHDVLWLGVWERNERAIRFYKKMGFLQMGSLPFVFGDDLHTDLVMVRELFKDEKT